MIQASFNKHIYILFFFCTSIQSYASFDKENEGIMVNNSKSNMYCYNDITPGIAICETPVAPGDICRGDAISATALSAYVKTPNNFEKKDFYVFRVPNKTRFKCNNTKGSIECHGEELIDAVIIGIYSFGKKILTEHQHNYYKLKIFEYMRSQGQSATIYKCTEDFKTLYPIYQFSGHLPCP